MRPDGMIFVQIDSNEFAHLKILLDEVFGRENYIDTIVTKATPNARDYGHIARQHEYIHVYAKDITVTQSNLLPDPEKTFSFEDKIGGFNVHPLYNSNVAFTNKNRPNLYYPFYLNPSNNFSENFYEIGLEEKKGWIEIYPPLSVKDKIQFVWRWGREL